MQYLLIILLFSFSFSNKDLNRGQNVFGASFTGIHAGLFSSNGFEETNIFVYTLVPVNSGEDIGFTSGSGIAIKKRFYQDPYKGVFWGCGISISSLKWRDHSLDDGQTPAVSEFGHGIRPFFEFGWRFGNKITMAPVIGIGYRFTSLEIPYDQKPEGGISMHMGFGLAIRFFKEEKHYSNSDNPFIYIIE